MNRTRLNLGAYILQSYARTERHIREIAESGLDFITCGLEYTDTKTLDLFYKYGLGAIVCGALPEWWGGNGENAGKMSKMNPLPLYEKAAENFCDHPAVWGIDCGDEPSALDVPHCGKIIGTVDRTFPNQFGYLNIYPNYAVYATNDAADTVSQLGTKNYSEYIENYCRYVPTDYICFDFYCYSADVPKFYENLRIVADACRHTGRSLWIVLQLNSHREDYLLSADQLRFQAYTALCFGAETVIWACYTGGWWYHNALDESGNKTEQYEKLKTVNGELRALSEDYFKFRRRETYIVGGEDLRKSGIDSLRSLDIGRVRGLRAEGDRTLIVGDFERRDGEKGGALCICAADDPSGRKKDEYLITFETDAEKICCRNAYGTVAVERSESGRCAISVRTNEFIMISTE